MAHLDPLFQGVLSGCSQGGVYDGTAHEGPNGKDLPSFEVIRLEATLRHIDLSNMAACPAKTNKRNSLLFTKMVGTILCSPS